MCPPVVVPNHRRAGTGGGRPKTGAIIRGPEKLLPTHGRRPHAPAGSTWKFGQEILNGQVRGVKIARVWQVRNPAIARQSRRVHGRGNQERATYGFADGNTARGDNVVAL